MQKYLKYKTKYLRLKNLIAGSTHNSVDNSAKQEVAELKQELSSLGMSTVQCSNPKCNALIENHSKCSTCKIIMCPLCSTYTCSSCNKMLSKHDITGVHNCSSLSGGASADLKTNQLTLDADPTLDSLNAAINEGNQPNQNVNNLINKLNISLAKVRSFKKDSPERRKIISEYNATVSQLRMQKEFAGIRMSALLTLDKSSGKYHMKIPDVSTQANPQLFPRLGSEDASVNSSAQLEHGHEFVVIGEVVAVPAKDDDQHKPSSMFTYERSANDPTRDFLNELIQRLDQIVESRYVRGYSRMSSLLLSDVPQFIGFLFKNSVESDEVKSSVNDDKPVVNASDFKEHHLQKFKALLDMYDETCKNMPLQPFTAPYIRRYNITVNKIRSFCIKGVCPFGELKLLDGNEVAKPFASRTRVIERPLRELELDWSGLPRERTVEEQRGEAEAAIVRFSRKRHIMFPSNTALLESIKRGINKTNEHGLLVPPSAKDEGKLPMRSKIMIKETSKLDMPEWGSYRLLQRDIIAETRMTQFGDENIHERAVNLPFKNSIVIEFDLERPDEGFTRVTSDFFGLIHALMGPHAPKQHQILMPNKVTALEPKKAKQYEQLVAFDKFVKTFLTSGAIDRNYKLIMCEDPNCSSRSGFCIDLREFRALESFDPETGLNITIEDRRVQCPGLINGSNSCHAEYCFECGNLSHGERSCLTPEMIAHQKAFRENLAAAGMGDTKPCPNCGEAISRIDGCNTVKCSKCVRDFCYRCGRGFVPADPWIGHHQFHDRCGVFFAGNEQPVAAAAADWRDDRNEDEDD